MLTDMAEVLAGLGVPVGGIVAPRVVEAGSTVGYDVKDLSSGRMARLARLRPPGAPVGRFFLSGDGLQFAAAALRHGLAHAQVVFVDEIGPAELASAGHAGPVREVIRYAVPAVFAIRSELVRAAQAQFGLEEAAVIAIDAPGALGPDR